MDHAPKYPLTSDISMFAYSIYQTADKLFKARNVPHAYERPGVRRLSQMHLTPEDLARVGDALMSYGIHAPDEGQLVIEGSSPQDASDLSPSTLWIATGHYTSAEKIRSVYHTSIDKQAPQQITAYKTISSITRKYADKAPLEYGDQHGLLEMIRLLANE